MYVNTTSSADGVNAFDNVPVKFVVVVFALVSRPVPNKLARYSKHSKLVVPEPPTETVFVWVTVFAPVALATQKNKAAWCVVDTVEPVVVELIWVQVLPWLSAREITFAVELDA